MSRPWNVDDNFVPIIQSVFVISRTPSMPSRCSTSVSRPLSGSTKYCPRFDLATIALRVLPTPGSTTTTKTVSAG